MASVRLHCGSVGCPGSAETSVVTPAGDIPLTGCTSRKSRPSRDTSVSVTELGEKRKLPVHDAATATADSTKSINTAYLLTVPPWKG
jgi:hypothetical protein